MPTKPQHQLVYRPVPPFLRSLRQGAGLTQRELARKIRKTQSWVQKSEIGSRRVDVAEFAIFCRGCGVDVRQAIGELLR